MHSSKKSLSDEQLVHSVSRVRLLAQPLDFLAQTRVPIASRPVFILVRVKVQEFFVLQWATRALAVQTAHSEGPGSACEKRRDGKIWPNGRSKLSVCAGRERKITQLFWI